MEYWAVSRKLNFLAFNDQDKGREFNTSNGSKIFRAEKDLNIIELKISG